MSNEEQTPYLFTWRQAVLETELVRATTKHILLTMSCYMDASGNNCYPSIETIASNSSRSCKTVVECISKAKYAGFIEVHDRGIGGYGWKRHWYKPTLPNWSALHFGIIPPTKAASDKQKNRAQRRVQKAIREGVMHRADQCTACGEVDVKTVAHHHDYDDTYNVTFLCHVCHSQLHQAESRGEIMPEIEGGDDTTPPKRGETVSKGGEVVYQGGEIVSQRGERTSPDDPHDYPLDDPYDDIPPKRMAESVNTTPTRACAREGDSVNIF